jgi:hypothetical protein
MADEDDLGGLLKRYSARAKQEHDDPEVDRMLKAVRGAVEALRAELASSDLRLDPVVTPGAPELADSTVALIRLFTTMLRADIDTRTTASIAHLDFIHPLSAAKKSAFGTKKVGAKFGWRERDPLTPSRSVVIEVGFAIGSMLTSSEETILDAAGVTEKAIKAAVASGIRRLEREIF